MKFPPSSALVLAILWPLAGHCAEPKDVPLRDLILAQAGVRCVAGVVTNPAEGSPTGYPCPPGSVPSNTTGSDAPRPPPPRAGAAAPVGGPIYGPGNSDFETGNAAGPANDGGSGEAAGAAGRTGEVTGGTGNTTDIGSTSAPGIGGIMDTGPNSRIGSPTGGTSSGTGGTR